VSSRLGNTPKICQSCYVHPGVLEAYAAGRLRMPRGSRGRGRSGLSGAERAVQRLLRRYGSAAPAAGRSARGVSGPGA